VGIRGKIIICADSFLDLFYGRVAKFQHTTAFKADQMVVVLMAIGMFVVGMLFTEANLSYQLAIY